MKRSFILIGYVIVFAFLFSCDDDKNYTGGDYTGGKENVVCEQGNNPQTTVSEPEFLMNIKGQTGWYASPVIYDLDGDGTKEIIAAYYNLYVYDQNGNELSVGEEGEGRIYAPHIVTDLDNDGITEIAVGRGNELIVYEWKNNTLQLKDGWPADTTTGDNPPEIRGMSCADLDGDGIKEIIVSTTQTVKTEDGGAQVFVFSSNGQLFQPSNGHSPAWPRYNNLSGEGNDADRNGYGHHGYGCYGLNVGVGNIDDDPELEIIVTYDNHNIQAFDYDGVAIDATSYFTNRSNEYEGELFTWGQFIRWADPDVENNHYHLHTGDWPNPSWTEWLQWTASPPSVADLDNDGKNEVIGVPNIEMKEPYETQAYGIFVLDGNYESDKRSAMRKKGWEVLPRGEKPINVDGWYPPKGVPAPVIVNLQGDDEKEIVVSMNDGFMYAISKAQILWRFNYRHNKRVMYASEPVVADLNQDGSPEVIFSTYGDPDSSDSGYLMILSATGKLLWDIPLPEAGHNGNGNGAPSAPTVGDLDGDGQLEILVQTFDHGLDIFTIPLSSDNCILWSTARGGLLRKGNIDNNM